MLLFLWNEYNEINMGTLLEDFLIIEVLKGIHDVFLHYILTLDE